MGKALREVAGALGASLELDDLLEVVLREVVGVLDAERAILFLHDEGRGALVSRAASRPEDHRLNLPLGDGWLSQVVRTGVSTRINDCTKSPRPVEWDATLGVTTVAALLCPLKSNLGRTIGVLAAIDRRGGGTFDADDEDLLSLMAKQTAVAMDNSRLFMNLVLKNQELSQAQVQLTRRVRDLELLFNLERRTAHALSEAELARAVLESLARSCDAEGAVLVLADGRDEAFIEFFLRRAESSATFPREMAADFRSSVYFPTEGLLGPVILTGTPLQMDTMPEPLVHIGYGAVRSVIAEALEGDGAPLGALALLNKRGGPFTAEDLGLLRLVSANVSTAVRLFQSNRAREQEERLTGIGRVLSQVVHDLKSPLTVISGYVQLMEDAEERPQRQQYAAEILKQFRSLGAMQSEVLAFARGETKVFSRKVIVDRFFDDLRGRLETELEGRNVELRLSASRRLVAHFDSERVTRALQNLVRNAAEALTEQGGGRVSVTAGLAGGDLFFEVMDDGPGIPAEIATRIFQSFVTSGKKGGTGLGLAIVKRIATEHGGRISLEPVVHGTCFRITLPQPGAAPSEAPPVLPPAERRKASPRAPVLAGRTPGARPAAQPKKRAQSPGQRS